MTLVMASLQEQIAENHNKYSTLPTTPQRRKYADGGYGWVIVFLSFVLYLIADGIAYPLGLINSAWLDYFKQSETKTSWIGSIFYAMPLLSGPVMSQLVERFGCKRMTIIGGAISSFGFIMSSLCNSVEQLYLTIGVIGGSGLSAAYIVGLLSVERWFEARRGLAIGIVCAGTGFGTFIFPSITQFCLDIFGWRMTVLCLSGLLMIVSLVGAFLDDPQWKIDEDAEAKDKSKITGDEDHIDKKLFAKLLNFVDFSHFHDRNFALLGAATFIIYAFYNTAIYFMTEMLRKFDLEHESANFLSVIGFFLMIGMIVLGWSADRKNTNVVVLNAGCVLLCGISESLMPFFALNSFTLSILCAVFGFTFASAYVLIPKIAELIVGVDHFASAIGLNFFMQGLGLLVGTPFAGWIYELSGSWSVSFYVSGGLISLSSILAFLIKAAEKENAE